jgi:hypothetical protein
MADNDSRTDGDEQVAAYDQYATATHGHDQPEDKR